MHLDLLTLVAMGSFVAACAGAVLLVAWSRRGGIACAQTILDRAAAEETLSALPKGIETVRWR